MVGGSLERTIDYEALVAESPDHPIGESVGLDDRLLLPHTSGQVWLDTQDPQQCDSAAGMKTGTTLGHLSPKRDS